MRRTRAPDNTGVLPAMTDSETGGYYTAGPPATVFSADDANIIQEELVAIATMKGASLDTAGTNIDQCAEALEGVKAIESKNVEASALTSYWKLAAIASTDATIGEDDGGVVHAAVMATDSCKARGFESAAIASEDCNAGNAAGTSNHVAVIASNKVAVEGDESAAIASECTISGTATSTATRGAMVAASWDSAGTKLTGTDVAVIASNDSTVGGTASGVMGGSENTIDAVYAFIGGGHQNVINTGGDGCAIVGGWDNEVTGNYSGALAGVRSSVSGNDCAALGGQDNDVDGFANATVGGSYNTTPVGASESVIVGGSLNEVTSDRSAIVGCYNTILNEYASVALASVYLDSSAGGNESNYMVCGGYDAATPVAPSWLIKSNGGVIYATNTTVQSADYAEMFPNADGAAHQPGRILMRAGKGCRIAGRGGRVLGVVSVMPTVLGNADGLHWQGTYERDEWGAELLVEAEEQRRGKAHKVVQRKLSPQWDRARKHMPRTKRPDEWTAVGLLGQLRVAVDATVGEGDFVEPGDVPGIGTRTRDGEPGKGRPIECMEITSPFDAVRGYAIALCLVG